MTYERLTMQSMSLHSERESLIDAIADVKQQLNWAGQRLKDLDSCIEGNLLQQEIYWPNFNEPEPRLTTDLSRDFFNNPNLTLRVLGKRHGISGETASKRLSKFFKMV